MVDEQSTDTSAGAARGSAGFGRPQRWRPLLVALLLLVIASRVVAIFGVAINWDEFVLAGAAHDVARTGELRSAGRPGLAVLFLLPFVADCEDEIATIRAARGLWLLFTLLFLAGFATLLGELAPRRKERLRTAALGVGLLALVPAFLEWSIQLRTDQLALVGGAWGGALLLASRRRPGLAVAAGLCFAVGYLGSQKLLYVAALSGLLAAGQLLIRGELRPGRETIRGVGCAAGIALALLAFRGLTAALFDVAEGHPSQAVMTTEAVTAGLSLFDFYRSTLGFSQYRALLPTVIPHLLLAAGLAVTTGVALRRREARDPALLVAWLVLALGCVVGWFHAAAFSYFWMTLGLFPAVALSLAAGPILSRLAPLSPRLRGLTVAAFWTALALPGLLHAGLMLRDTQAVQRESLDFVARNFDPGDAGFHPEDGLFCRPAGSPVGTWFSQTIYKRFDPSQAGDDAPRQRRWMMERFREEPVKFIMQSFRLNQFPVELRRFWARYYQPYRASVFVAGRRLEAEPNATTRFELIVPGRYRWLPLDSATPIAIDGRPLEPGGAVDLDRGEHAARFGAGGDRIEGLLVLAVEDSPGPAPLAFYKAY